MSKRMQCIGIISVSVIAVIASAILYRMALSSYMLDNHLEIYYSIRMLLKGLFCITDLIIAVIAAFKCFNLIDK